MGADILTKQPLRGNLTDLIDDFSGITMRGGGCWAVVLAGGDGQRMQEAVRQWMGEALPKQFCSFVDNKTLLESTWQRARKLVGDQHILTLANSAHQRYFLRYDQGLIPGKVLYQPGNYGTAPAVYMGLAHILAVDPDALVIILPSDHFIHPEARFVNLASQVFAFVKQHPEQPVLFGADVLDANVDYGWMDVETDGWSTGAESPHSMFKKMKKFYEKPTLDAARGLYAGGALCSTMIMVTSARRLWQIGQARSPELLDRMESVRKAVQRYPQTEKLHDYLFSVISHAYHHMPMVDFSREIIQPAGHEYLVVDMKGIEWDDWGRPERIVNTALRHGFSCPEFR